MLTHQREHKFKKMPAIGDRPHWPNSEALNCELAGDVERGFEAPEKCRKKRPPAPLTLTADMCGVCNKGQAAKCRASTPALGGLVLFRSFFVGASSCDPSIDAKSPPDHS